MDDTGRAYGFFDADITPEEFRARADAYRRQPGTSRQLELIMASSTELRTAAQAGSMFGAAGAAAASAQGLSNWIAAYELDAFLSRISQRHVVFYEHHGRYDRFVR